MVILTQAVLFPELGNSPLPQQQVFIDDYLHGRIVCSVELGASRGLFGGLTHLLFELRLP